MATFACFFNIRPYDLNMRTNAKIYRVEKFTRISKMVLFFSQSVIFTSYDVIMTSVFGIFRPFCTSFHIFAILTSFLEKMKPMLHQQLIPLF